MTFLKRIVPALLVVAVASCAPFQLVENKPITVDATFNVQPQMTWSSVTTNQKHVALWTVDGTSLNALYFFTGVSDGDTLIEIANAERKELRPYRHTMLPDDVMEYIGFYLTRMGAQQLKTANLRPAKIGTAQGFRFEASYVTRAGLKMKAMALFTQPGGKLCAMLFLAPDEYYYGHIAGQVDTLFNTATLNG